MDKIDLGEVARKYNDLDVIWAPEDKWHIKTWSVINKFILEYSKNTSGIEYFKILNAGSGGNSYSLPEQNILHIDIAKTKICNLKNFLISDIQDTGLPSASFDLIVCVGSVINYCDPILVFAEFARLSKYDAEIIIEFESSFTFELAGKKNFNKRAALMNTFYNGRSEKIWYFSESYIKELAQLYGFNVRMIKRFHILSPLVMRITENINLAARFAYFDNALSRIPFLRKFSSNVILLFKRN